MQKVVKETISIIIIVVTVFTFRSVFFEPFRIPSGSMIPSLMIGDFILVNKFSYGFKVPFSDMSWNNSLFAFDLNPIYMFGKDTPKRGDVIVFKYPGDPSINYIKRVIGLPGDEIEVINNVVYVNDVPLFTKKIDGKEIMDDMDDKFKKYSFNFFDAKTGEHKHVVQKLAYGSGPRATTEKIKVPLKKYFVMGDNRDFSADSRFWKFVPEENIRGKAMFVWFSMIIPILGDDPFKLRLHRIGTVIN
jgi:signal peptidase I